MAQDITISNKRLDSRLIGNKSVKLSRFLDIGFKGSDIADCNFNHGRFERCYFRNAKFRNVSLKNCSFKDCNFHEATFVDCHFDYSEFENCNITFEQLENCFPPFENLRMELARNLRINAQNRGDPADYRKFLKIEISASKVYNRRKAFGNIPYYRERYHTIDARLSGLVTYLRLELEGYFWGHGEAPFRVLLTGALLVLLFGIVFYALKADIQNLPTSANFLDYLGLSLATLATGSYGNVVLLTTEARLLATVERASGVVIFGFFVAALYRSISKR